MRLKESRIARAPRCKIPPLHKLIINLFMDHKTSTACSECAEERAEREGISV